MYLCLTDLISQKRTYPWWVGFSSVKKGQTLTGREFVTRTPQGSPFIAGPVSIRTAFGVDFPNFVWGGPLDGLLELLPVSHLRMNNYFD